MFPKTQAAEPIAGSTAQQPSPTLAVRMTAYRRDSHGKKQRYFEMDQAVAALKRQRLQQGQ
jgi:hypothetical protein